MTIPKHIIICNNEDNIDKFEELKPYKITKYIKELIYGKIFNPPFFDLIIVNETIEYKQMELIYNNLNKNGILIISNKYLNLFNKIENIDVKMYKNYIRIQKTNNYIFQIPNRLVDVLICGVQKASTTSALINLRKHKDISSHTDEIHYIDLFWYKGESFYRKYHDYTKKIVLEKNPDLLYLDWSYSFIQQMNPFIKLIIFLRNPIYRAYSSWQMMKNNKWTNLTFEESINEELTYRLNENKTFNTSTFHYLQRGLYYEQITKLLKWFPMENIKIFITEHFSDNMEKEYNDIYEFIGIDKIYNNKYTKERINVYENKIDQKLYDKLVDFFKEDTEKLEQLIGIKTNWFITI